MDTVGFAVEDLLSDAEDALIAKDRPVGLVVFAPGNNVVWDNCCAASDGGGQLWVRVVSVLPQPAGAQPCDITDLQVRVGLGVVRCMLGGDEEGFPTAEEMLEDARGAGRDAEILLTAIRDWAGTQHVNLKSLRVEQGLPLGPQGYCGGWEWTLVFRVLMQRD